MRPFTSNSLTVGILVALAAVATTAPAVSASQVLLGQIEMIDAPRVDQFEDAVRHDGGLPCWVKAAMPRLFRVAHDERMRPIVWKRMCRQELLMVDHKLLVRIEHLAEACNMPLHTPI